ADDPDGRGRRPGRARRAGPGRDPVPRFGHDADLLPADVPRRPTRHRAPQAGVPLRGSRGRGRLPAVPPLPPDGGRDRLTRGGDTAAERPYTPDILDQPTMPTRRGATKASPVLVWTAILILYLAWGSTY